MKRLTEKVFYFLSKTDTEVIKKCTKETQLTQMSIGMIVLLAGMFAFVSGFFAINFIAKDYLIAALVALLYAIAIITFDREIVSSTGKKSLLLRIPFAIIIGLVISYPLEIKVLQDAVTLKATENASAIAKTEYDKTIALINMDKEKELALIQQQIESCKNEVTILEQQLANERRSGHGPKAKAIELNIVNKTGECTKLTNKKSEINKDSDEIKKQKEIAWNKKIEQEQLHNDFLSQAMALEKLTTNSDLNHKWYEQNSAWWIATVLKLFFVTLELMGVLIKLFMKYNEYHAYLDCRRALNVQKVNAVGNLFLDEIKQNPLASLEVDYTDQIVKGLEDRSDEHLVDDSIVVPGQGIKDKA